MLKRGVCGVELKHQIVVTGFLYAAIGLIGFIFGFILLENPQFFADNALARDKSWENKETQRLEESRVNDEHELDDILNNIKHPNVEVDDDASDPLEDPDLDPFIDRTWQEVTEEDPTAVKASQSTLNAEDEDSEEDNQDQIDSKEEGTADENESKDSDVVEGVFVSADDTNLVFEEDGSEEIDSSLVDEENAAQSVNNDETVFDKEEEAPKGESKKEEDGIKDLEREKRETADESEASEEENLRKKGTLHSYYQLIKFIENEGVEVMIASLVRFVCSGILIMGARSNRPWLLVPWLVEESIEMVGGLLQLIMHTARNGTWSFKGLILLLVLYVLGGYFLYSVASYHALLRRMVKQSKEVISSVCQGGFQVGLNYQRLEEDCWQADPNLATEFKDRDSGFRRESRKDVDEIDDYVLYVK